MEANCVGRRRPGAYRWRKPQAGRRMSREQREADAAATKSDVAV